jgi:hypothetical protein
MTVFRTEATHNWRNWDMTMDQIVVRGRINELLYSILFSRDLKDDTKLDFVVESIREQRTFRHSAAEYSEAIASVLRDGHLPPNVVPEGNHSEGEVVHWLGRLAERLRPDVESASATLEG